jgi:hypothetical protein
MLLDEEGRLVIKATQALSHAYSANRTSRSTKVCWAVVIDRKRW